MELEGSDKNQGKRNLLRLPDGSYLDGNTALINIISNLDHDGNVLVQTGKIRRTLKPKNVDFDNLPPEEQDDLRQSLAEAIYLNLDTMCMAMNGSAFHIKMRERLEPFIAIQLSPFLDNNELLEQISQLVDEKIISKYNYHDYNSL